MSDNIDKLCFVDLIKKGKIRIAQRNNERKTPFKVR